MSVTDGQSANAVTFNGAFMSRTANDSTTGKKDLQNADTASGPNVINVQREVNSLNSYTGRPSGSAHDATPIWTNNDAGSGTNTLKERAEALSTKFNLVSGHAHSGGAGDGAPISASSLEDLNYYKGVYQAVVVTGANGTTYDVSAQMAGKTPGGDTSIEGVVTSAPFNRVIVVDSNTQTGIQDANGQEVYGRLTYAASVWTLSFYTNEAGVETAHNLSSTDIQVFFVEVFTLANIPTFDAYLGRIQTLDLTSDIVDATGSQRGLVSTGVQTFGGNKTFTGTIGASNLSGTNTGDVTSTAIGSTPNANGLTLTGQQLNLEPASASFGGVVTTGVQSFAGNKTFTGTIGASNLSGTNSGDVTLAAVGSSPNANGATLTGQQLNLEPASASFAGVVSTLAQTFAGDKTFQDFLEAQSEIYGSVATDSTSTGANQTLSTPAVSILRVTNGSLTSIDGVTAPTKAQLFVLINAKGSSLDVNNQLGTAANQIITGTGANLSVGNGASIWLLYDTTTAKWRVVGGSGGGASVSPLTTKGDIYVYSTMDARLPVGTNDELLRVNSATATGLAWGSDYSYATASDFNGTNIVATKAAHQKWRTDHASPTVLSTITVTNIKDGSFLYIMGTNNTNTITLNNNDVANGWLLNGSWTSSRGSVLTLIWDSALQRFYEISRT